MNKFEVNSHRTSIVAKESTEMIVDVTVDSFSHQMRYLAVIRRRFRRSNSRNQFSLSHCRFVPETTNGNIQLGQTKRSRKAQAKNVFLLVLFRWIEQRFSNRIFLFLIYFHRTIRTWKSTFFDTIFVKNPRTFWNEEKKEFLFFEEEENFLWVRPWQRKLDLKSKKNNTLFGSRQMPQIDAFLRQNSQLTTWFWQSTTIGCNSLENSLLLTFSMRNRVRFDFLFLILVFLLQQDRRTCKNLGPEKWICPTSWIFSEF